MSLVPAGFSDAAAMGFAMVVQTEPDPDAAADLADALKKMRDALDHIAWDAWLRAGGDETAKVYFPVGDTPERVLASRLSKKVPEQVRSLFLDVQRLDENAPVFAQISKFAAGAKHTHPTVAAIPERTFEAKMPEPPPGLLLSLALPQGIRPTLGQHMVAWVLWHQEDDDTFTPLPPDDPRLRDAPPYPDLSMAMSFGVECRDVSFSIAAIRDAVARVEHLRNEYDSMVLGRPLDSRS